MRVDLLSVPYDSGVRAARMGACVSDVTALIDEAARAFRIRAVALSAYDPSQDADGRACEAAISLVVAAVNAVSRENDSSVR